MHRRPVPSDDDRWTESLGAWSDQARRMAGNPVNLVEVSADELPDLLARPVPSLWTEIASEGVLLLGPPIDTVGAAA